MKNTQNGFTLVEALLILVVLAIIGFGGYYVMNNQNKSNDANSTQNDQSNTSTDSSYIKPDALTLTDLGVVITDVDNKGLILKSTEIKPTYASPWTQYYITTKDNTFEADCGYPVAINSASAEMAAAQKDSTEAKYVMIDDRWFSIGTGERYSATVWCKNGETVTGYDEYVADLFQYVAENISAQ